MICFNIKWLGFLVACTGCMLLSITTFSYAKTQKMITHSVLKNAPSRIKKSTAVTKSASIYFDATHAIMDGEDLGRSADRLARKENISKSLPDHFWGGTGKSPTKTFHDKMKKSGTYS